MPSTRCLLAALALLALPLGADALGVLDRVKANRTLAVAYDPHAYPISFKDDLDKPAGYAPDLCRRVATAIQRDLGLPGLAIKWIEGNTPRRLAAVVNGEADLDCATTTLTLERQRQVDFSNVVFIESGAILTRMDARTHARDYADLADLAEGRLGVVPETTTERRLRRVLRLRSINMQLVPIKDAKDGREQLLAGTLDAVAGDRLVLLGQVETAGAVGPHRPGGRLLPGALRLRPTPQRRRLPPGGQRRLGRGVSRPGDRQNLRALVRRGCRTLRTAVRTLLRLWLR